MKPLMDNMRVEAKIEHLNELVSDLHEKLDSITEDYEKLESEFGELVVEDFKQGLEKKKIEERLCKVEQQQFDRDVRTDLFDRNVKLLVKDGTYFLSADHEKKHQKLNVVYQFVFPANMNVRRDVRRWMRRKFNRKVAAVPSFPADEFHVVVNYIESRKPKAINEFVYESK
jgi:regulator of replication initiation timing